jgi:L-alanine-DL-glutamate epimerase-like enolase superfamily enzyme
MKIKQIRPVLLSAPYARKNENLEVDFHLSSGYRTVGMVEITLEDGTKGYGEGYLAVFAPQVFVEIVTLITPYIIGEDIMNIEHLLKKIGIVTGYWSSQGAAQHVVSAFDIAIHDCKAQLLGIPVYQLYNPNAKNTIKLYGSGGDSPTPELMKKEFEYLNTLGIKAFKIRARNNQVEKARFALREGRKYGIEIAIDMTQNLANPGQSVNEVVAFHEKICTVPDSKLFFLEEVLGIYNGDNYPSLRKLVDTLIAGGEIVTTSKELNLRIEQGWYDIVQPDATVIGGIKALCEVFKKASEYNTQVFVHCWGGPVCMAANYHSALAFKGEVAEWPMPYYPLRDKMLIEPWSIKNGKLTLPEIPGLGIKLNKDIEEKYPFRETAIYSCIPKETELIPDEKWNI